VSLDHRAPAGNANIWFRRAGARIETAVRRLLSPPRVAVPWPSRQSIAIAAVCFVALFVLFMVMLDAPAIIAARGLPPLINAIFQVITGFGKGGWFLYPLGILMLAIALAPPQLPRMAQLTLAAVMARAGFLFIAIGLPGLFTDLVKHVFGRARPFVTGVADPYVFHPFTWPAAYASLPSGHATTAFAAAIAIGAIWPRSRTVLWIYAALIGVSRVVIYAHHPSDVLAGAVIGGVGALLVRQYFAARGLAFGVTPQGAIVAFPGPSKRRIKSVARALLAE
jgi:membrane-associated phospholipid phosphatase